MSKFNIDKKEKEISTKVKYFFNKFGIKHPGFATFLVVMKYFLGSSVVALLITLVITVIQMDDTNELVPQTLPAKTEKTVEEESPIEKRINNDKHHNQCAGAEFEIVEQLSPAGGDEGFDFPNPEDDHVVKVATSSSLYQGSYKTSWNCEFPYTIETDVIPIEGESLGHFIEVENLYKVVTGDGDRRTIKVERNEYGYRSDWKLVGERIKLSEEILDRYPVTIKLRTERQDRWIQVDYSIYYNGKSEPESYSFELQPPSLDSQDDKKYHVRVGINDTRFEGNGIIARLGTLSITEVVEQ